MSLAEFGDIADQQLAKGKGPLSGLTKSGKSYLKPTEDNEASEGSGSEEILVEELADVEKPTQPQQPRTTHQTPKSKPHTHRVHTALCHHTGRLTPTPTPTPHACLRPSARGCKAKGWQGEINDTAHPHPTPT